MDLKFEINKQLIKRIDNESPVQKSQNFVSAIFDFKDTFWEGLTKYALFGIVDENNEYKTYNIALDTEDTCTVPWEVLLSNEVHVSGYGTNEQGSQIVTLNQIIIYLEETGYTQDLTPTREPSQDIFVDIYEKIHTKFDNVLVDGSFINFYAEGELIKQVRIREVSSVSWSDVTGKPETFPASDSSLEVCLNGLAREINKL